MMFSLSLIPSPKIHRDSQRPRGTGARVNAPKSIAGHSGLGLSCLCHRGPPGFPLWDSLASPGSFGAAGCRQVHGGRRRWPGSQAGSPRGGGGESVALSGACHALARESGRPRGDSPAAAKPGRPGQDSDPESWAREEPPRVRAQGRLGAPGPAAYPARRRLSVLPPLGSPRLSASCRPLAARNHGHGHIHTESRCIKTHVQPPATYLYS